MASSPPLLKLDPTPLTSIPTGPELTKFVQQLIIEGRSLIEKVTSPPQAPWHHHSKKYDVELSSRDVVVSSGKEEYWFARRSIHKIEDWIGWEQWTGTLLDGHAENEAKYIPSLKKVDRIAGPGFELQDAVIEGYSKIRLDVYGQPVLGKTVLGKYVSVERVQVTESGDSVEWLMGTASDACGNLPMSVQRRSIPGTIAKDVPSFLDWIKDMSKK